MCPGEAGLQPESCPVARGHYDRVNDAVYDIFTRRWGSPGEKVLDYAARHNVCPPGVLPGHHQLGGRHHLRLQLRVRPRTCA